MVAFTGAGMSVMITGTAFSRSAKNIAKSALSGKGEDATAIEKPSPRLTQEDSVSGRLTLF